MVEERSLARAGMRGSLVTVSAQAISMFFRIFGLIVLARLLTPSLFGLAAIAVAISTFASSIIFLGLPMATAQAEKLSNRAQSSLFLVNLVLGILVCSLMFFSASAISRYYEHPLLEDLIQWLAIVPLLSGIQSQFRLTLVRSLRFTVLGVSDVVGQGISTIVSIFLALSGYSVAAIITQNVVMVLVQSIIVIFAARWAPGMPGAWSTEVLPILRVGINIFGINILRDGSRSALIPIMATQSGPSALGAYDRAQQLSIVPISLTVDQLQRVVVPVLTRLRNDRKKLGEHYRRAQLMVCYTSGASFAFLAAVSPVLVEIFLGSDWAEAGLILQILSVGAVFRAIAHATQWLFISSGATAASLKLSAVAQPSILLMSLAGLPWGVFGVAIANSIAWAIYWPISSVVAARVSGFASRPLVRDCIRCFFLFCLPVGVAASLAGQLSDLPFVSFGLSVVSAIASVVLLFLIAQPLRRDFMNLKSAMLMARDR